MQKKRLLKLGLMILIILLFLIAIILSIYEKQWVSFLIAIVGLFSVFLPTLLEKRFKIDIAEGLEIIVLIFLYSYFYLGEYLDFFYRIWWWDILLHGIGLFLVGLFSFYIVYALNRKKSIAVKLSAFFVALFAFCFALSIGVLWEIFEFLMDSLFNLNMQKSGLVDTMSDLIIGSFGAFIASVLGYVYMKRDTNRFYRRIRGWVKAL
ncbi:MAG: hypothetical protein ACP5D2_01720 [Candidatus Nanoarchaeia archaeon]